MIIVIDGSPENILDNLQLHDLSLPPHHNLHQRRNPKQHCQSIPTSYSFNPLLDCSISADQIMDGLRMAIENHFVLVMSALIHSFEIGLTLL